MDVSKPTTITVLPIDLAIVCSAAETLIEAYPSMKNASDVQVAISNIREAIGLPR